MLSLACLLENVQIIRFTLISTGTILLLNEIVLYRDDLHSLTAFDFKGALNLGCCQIRHRLSSHQADREADKDLCFTLCISAVFGMLQGHETGIRQCYASVWVAGYYCVRARMAVS